MNTNDEMIASAEAAYDRAAAAGLVRLAPSRTPSKPLTAADFGIEDQNDKLIASAEAAYDRAAAAGLVRAAPPRDGGVPNAAPTAPAAGTPIGTDVAANGGVTIHINLPGEK